MGSNKNGRVEKVCRNCEKVYSVKFSHSNRSTYCSKSCQAEAYKERYKGVNNPNYNKNVDRDYDGYVLSYKIGRIALHRLVAMEVLGLSKLPTGYQVHHRDCNINNNTPENLSLLSAADHRWLHKQFGNATLWAYCHGKISLEELCSWSTDPQKAETLLPLTLEKQIGVFKSDELLENLEVGNQQPS